jgi:hypothetical protein
LDAVARTLRRSGGAHHPAVAALTAPVVRGARFAVVVDGRLGDRRVAGRTGLGVLHCSAMVARVGKRRRTGLAAACGKDHPAEHGDGDETHGETFVHDVPIEDPAPCALCTETPT